jgi:hypothetical protein
VEPKKIRAEYEEIKNDIAHDINNLYQTKCRKCKNNFVPAICFTWDKGKLVDVRYECPHHGKRIDKVTEDDQKRFDKILNHKVEQFFDKLGESKYWYPTQKFYYEDGRAFKEKQQYESVDDLFTIRNLVALAMLMDRIQKINDYDLRESFKFAFSSITHLASKMTPVRSSRPFSSAWVQQSYWFAENNMESNVWGLFESTILDKQGLIKQKKDIPQTVRVAIEGTKTEQLERDTKNYWVIQKSAIDALDEIGENKVDYIITDPPYGHSIQYFELLFMWGCWLKLMKNWTEIAKGEIIENLRQDKTIEKYENMLYVTFRKAYEVLKPEKVLTITFHNPDIKYRNILFRSVVMAGFDFEKIIYQPPPRPSAKSRQQPFGSLEGDYFFRFKKPKTKREENVAKVDEKRVEKLIITIAERIIAERGEPTHYTFIQNSIDPILYEELRKYGLLMDFQPKSVETILKKQLGKIFVLVNTVIGKKGQHTLMDRAWWFADPSEHRLDIPLNKRVDEVIVNLLRKEGKVTYTQVLTEVYTRFTNSLTPEEHTIMSILKENANAVSGGKWEIKPFVEKIEEKHEEMVYYIAKIGQALGYFVNIARDEYDKTFQGNRLSAQVKLVPLKLKGLTDNQATRISCIDVIWHDGKDIVAEFEVEHSTSIVDAVVRGSNIKSENVSRVMVIPDEREDLVSRRFSEPAMEAIMKATDWTIMTYEKLESFYKNDLKKKFSIEDFMSKTRKPLNAKEKTDKKQAKLFN